MLSSLPLVQEKQKVKKNLTFFSQFLRPLPTPSHPKKVSWQTIAAEKVWTGTPLLFSSPQQGVNFKA